MKILCFLLFLSNLCFAQSLILRPSIGSQYYAAKEKKYKENNFDITYNANKKIKKEAVAFSVELMFPRHSFELLYTKQHYARYFYTNYKSAGIAISLLTQGDLPQLQLIYNKFFDIKLSRFSLIYGGGIGFGALNKSELLNDTSWTNVTVYSISNPNDFIKRQIIEDRLSNYSVSAIFRLGFSYKKKKIERFRLMASYNLGINNILKNKIIYSHTNIQYSGINYFKGSQFSILASVPIYLKRFKK